MKKTILIVGCGDIALRTALLLKPRFRLLGLCRNLTSFDRLRAHGIIPISGDLDYAGQLEKLSGIAQIVLHLAPPKNCGVRDVRTANLLAALTKQSKLRERILPQQFVYISTSGVYGDCNGSLIDETHPVNPSSERALRRISAEKQIREWGVRTHVKVSILRVPGIYANNRLPLARLRKGSPTLVAEDDSYINLIHANDLARIICSTLHYAKPNRIYHACDDSQLRMGEYLDLVADQFSLPRPPRILRHQAKGLISPGMLSYLDESRRLKNTRMKKELHVSLCYPDILSGIMSES
jgi:nucleoside-diphosphate-sugar epimerase